VSLRAAHESRWLIDQPNDRTLSVSVYEDGPILIRMPPSNAIIRVHPAVIEDIAEALERCRDVIEEYHIVNRAQRTKGGKP